MKLKPKGTIYEGGKSGHHGEQILLLPWIFRVAMQIIRGVGAGMIATAVIIFMFTYGPILSQELNYKYKEYGIQSGVSEYEHVDIVEDRELVKADETEKVLEETRNYGITSYFSVVIPKIDAKANVIANVDPGNKKEYLDALQKGVAHAKGTNFPGQEGRVFLFSHSTDSPINFARYNAIFYLLKKLEKGDQIIVFFAEKKYVYEVADTKTVKPSDTEWIMPKSGDEELVLMTCDPPGTTWNRLLVIAKPVKE